MSQWAILAQRASKAAQARRVNKLPKGKTADLWFDSAEDAKWALRRVQGRKIRDHTLSAKIDVLDAVLVVVSNIPVDIAPGELEALFAENADEALAEVQASVGLDVHERLPHAPGTTMVGDVGEIEFETMEDVESAVAELDEKELAGKVISLEAAPLQDSPEGTKLYIYKLPSGVGWNEVKEHFETAGTVVFAGPKEMKIKRVGPAPRGALVGEVRFSLPDHVMDSVAKLDGGHFGKSQIAVQQDEQAVDGKKILVFGLPENTEWKELKDFFAKVGPVLFAGFRRQRFSEALNASAKQAEKLKAQEMRKAKNRAPKERYVGTVEFETPSHATKALIKMHGTNLGTCTVFCQLYPKVEAKNKLLVRGSSLGSVSLLAFQKAFAIFGEILSCKVGPVAQIAGKGAAEDGEEVAEHGEEVAEQHGEEVAEQGDDDADAEDQPKAKKRKTTTGAEEEEYTAEDWGAWEKAEKKRKAEKAKRKAEKAAVEGEWAEEWAEESGKAKKPSCPFQREY